MPDLLTTPRIRLQAAREKTTQLLQSLDEFKSRNPVRLIQVPAQDPEWTSVRLKISDTIPPNLSYLAGSIIEDYRASLDTMVVALALRNGHPDVSRVSLPFCQSEESFLSKNEQKKLDGLRDSDKRYVATLKPWKGGDKVLWTLNEAANTHKHRYLIPISTIPTTVITSYIVFKTLPGHLGNSFVGMDPEGPQDLTEGVEVAGYKVGTACQIGPLQALPAITMKGLEFADGVPIDWVLLTFQTRLDNIMADIESLF